MIFEAPIVRHARAGSGEHEHSGSAVPVDFLSRKAGRQLWPQMTTPEMTPSIARQWVIVQDESRVFITAC